jgi:membrane-bound ClpP family serine protease
MRPRARLLTLVAASILAIAAHAGTAAATTPRVLAIRFAPDLEVNPITKDYLNHQLDVSAKADVLALSSVSNVGSSTPIDSSGANITSDLSRKVINDPAASLRSLAATHRRNTTWPVLAVTKASNLTAPQALHLHVIDSIASSLPSLLRRLDGYRTNDAQRPFTLHLAGAQITTVSPGLSTRFLNTPSLAYGIGALLMAWAMLRLRDRPTYSCPACGTKRQVGHGPECPWRSRP